MFSAVTTRQTAVNIISQWGLNLTNIVINFFLIGYVIAKVGADHYGGWALIVSIIGYLSVLDAGMSVAVQHYVARLSARGEKDRLAGIFSSACVVYAVAGFVGVVVCFWLSLGYPALFPKVSAMAASECVVALKWVSAGIFLFIINMPVRAALLGLQRHYMRNAIEIIASVARMSLVLISFKVFGCSLTHLGSAFFGAMLISYVLSVSVLRLIEPSLRLRIGSVTCESLREIFSYGGHSLFWAIATVVVRESAPIVAIVLIGPAAATYLYVGTRLVRSLGIFVTSAGHVFVPVASSLQATNEMPRLQSALLRGTRFCCLFGLSAATILALFGRTILQRWVGFDDMTSYCIVLVITIGRLSAWMFIVPISVLMGMRVLRSVTTVLVICTICCFVLMFILSHYCGVLGLAVGSLLPFSVAYGLWAPVKVCRLTGVGVGKLLEESLPMSLLIAVIVAGIGWLVQQMWVPSELWILAVELGFVLFVFLVLAVSMGLDRRSRDFVLSKIWAP